MSTTQEKIAVMQAYAAGKKVECRIKHQATWHEFSGIYEPSWNWEKNEYRVAEDPLEKALKIYSSTAYPEFKDKWARAQGDAAKKGLEAVINAVKSGEIK